MSKSDTLRFKPTDSLVTSALGNVRAKLGHPWRFAFALAVSLFAFALTLANSPFEDRSPFLLFLILLLYTFWRGSSPQKLVLVLFAALSTLFFLLIPNYSIGATDASDLVRLVGFVLAALMISWLSASRNREEQVVQEQRALLRVTLNSIGDAVIATDSSGAVDFMNPIAEALTGWKQTEAQGKPLSVVFQIMDETTRQRIEYPMDQVLHEGVAAGLKGQTLLVARNGKRTPIDDSGSPIRQADGRIAGMVLVFRDITARRQAERQLQQSEEHVRSLVENIVDGIVTSDEQGTILSFNAAASKIFGYAPAEAIGQSVNLLMPDPYRQEHPDYMSAYLRTNVPRIIGIGREVSGRRKDGSIFPMDLGVSEYRIGERRYFTAIIRDITELRRVRLERERLLASQQAARAAAEEELVVRERFLKIASHELKSPLATLRGYVDLLTDRIEEGANFGKSDRHAIHSISRQADRLEHLCAALFDVSRLETGNLLIQRKPLDLSALTLGIVQDMRQALHQHRFEYQGSAEPLMIEGDESRLEQVLQNLFQNAIKYSHPGGLIHVQVGRRENGAFVRVTDRGIGIPAAELPLIFAPYYRGRSAGRLSIIGLGVGLYVVKEIVRLHGGDVEVTSEEGKGSTFTVSLPLMAEAERIPAG